MAGSGATVRKALQDASNRANFSPVVPDGQMTVCGKSKDPKRPTFQEYLSLTNLPAATQARVLSEAIAKHPELAGEQPAESGRSKSKSKSSATAGASSSNKKRKAETTLDEDIAAYKQNLDHVVACADFEDMPLPSCGSVRGRINKLLDSGIMTKTEFCRAIGANSNSLNRFLKQKGPMGGSGSCVWFNAWSWFKQREVAKIKMPDVKKRQKHEAEAEAAAAAAAAAKSVDGQSKSGSSSKTVATLPDISDIHLPGEETDDVEVYDTCDEIRRKINLHMKTPGLSAAQFCRDLYTQLNAPTCKSIQSKQLSDFRGAKGPRTGAKSTVFYAAYVYFEKLRIAQNKPKTAHRQEMEAIYAGRGGLERDIDHRTTYVGLAGTSLAMDQYGSMHSF